MNFEAFKSDYREVIERAQQADVRAIINVGSNFETSKKAIEIAEKYAEGVYPHTKYFGEGVYAAIGLHPIHVKPGSETLTNASHFSEKSQSSTTWKDERFDETEFLKLAKNKKVVAIGETGLDYYYDKSSAELQKEIFEKSLKIARAVSKPVILHSRDSGEDVLSVLMAQRPEPLGVMHCFQGNWAYAKMILDMGLYISFTGLITFSKNYETFEVIKNAPLDRLMIETDCPFMSPQLYRGKRNEPAFVIEVAKKIAEIKKLPLEKVAEETSKNAKKLFKI